MTFEVLVARTTLMRPHMRRTLYICLETPRPIARVFTQVRSVVLEIRDVTSALDGRGYDLGKSDATRDKALGELAAYFVPMQPP